MLGRLAIIVTLAAAMLPQPAGAAHWISCGGSWGAPGTTCDLSIRGLPVQLSGVAEASGRAEIRVWLTLATPSGPRTIAECSSSGNRYATCEGEFGVGAYLDPFVQSVPLTCHVAGRGAGVFTCASYAGPSG